jgi:hypothetical protein
MRPAGTFIEAIGLNIYYEAYGEGGRPKKTEFP